MIEKNSEGCQDKVEKIGSQSRKKGQEMENCGKKIRQFISYISFTRKV